MGDESGLIKLSGRTEDGIWVKKLLPTPLASSAAVGTQNAADAARFERSGRHQQTCQAEFARPSLAFLANGDSQ